MSKFVQGVTSLFKFGTRLKAKTPWSNSYTGYTLYIELYFHGNGIGGRTEWICKYLHLIIERSHRLDPKRGKYPCPFQPVNPHPTPDTPSPGRPRPGVRGERESSTGRTPAITLNSRCLSIPGRRPFQIMNVNKLFRV